MQTSAARDRAALEIRREDRHSALSLIRRSAEGNYPVLEDTPEVMKFVTDCLAQPATIDKFQQYVQQARSSNTEERLAGLLMLKKLAGCEGCPRMVIDAGLVPLLLAICQHSEIGQMKLQALWIVNSILSGDQLESAAVIQKGFLPIALALLPDPRVPIVEEVLWCLGNLTADNEQSRNAFLKQHGLTRVLETCKRLPLLAKSKVFWVIKNVVILKPHPSYSEVKEAFPLLVENLAGYPDSIELKDTLWGIATLANLGKPSHISCFFNEAMLANLKHIIATRDESLLEPTVRILGVLSSTDLSARVGVEGLLPALESEKKKVRKEAYWLLSNLAAHRDKADFVLGSDYAVKMFDALASDSPAVKREIVWLVRNLAKKASPQLAFVRFLNSSAIKSLLTELDSKDSKHLVSTLTALDSLFALECEGEVSPLVMKFMELGGGAALEQLQSHPSSQVYAATLKLLESNFEER